MRAILLVQALEEPDLIPPGLQTDCGRWLRNEEMFSSVAMQLCALQKDWAACAAHAEKACAASMEATQSYYYLGLARHHLGQPAESRAALEEYLRRVRHEPECAAARALLGQKAPAQ